uniref:Uncharacterized protein n=1 Tax=Spermophilus dauricus TaxID=99837 RepID=A0A8C9PTY6_SPEDA
MLLPLLGACAVVGPFQGPEWEPVRGLISQDCSCRDPRCCGNLLVLCLFLIWQVRHYWHHFTRNRLHRRSIIKVPSQKWAMPSMRCGIFFRLAPEFISPGDFRGRDAHIQQWVQKQRWRYRKSLLESWTQNLFSSQNLLQDSSWGAHTSHDPIFCISSFSSTCPLSQDSSWETWQVSWCLKGSQTHSALDTCQRIGQLLVHSQEKLVPLEHVLSRKICSPPTTFVISLPKLPSAQRLQFCSGQVPEPSSENSKGRKVIRPDVSQKAERASREVGTSSSRASHDPWKKEHILWEASQFPRHKYQQPTRWRRESLEPAEGRGARQLPPSVSTDSSSIKGSLHSKTAKLSMTLLRKMSWSPQLAKPRNSVPRLSRVGNPLAREDSIRVHTASERDHQPPGHCSAGVSLPRTKTPQGQRPHGAPKNSSAPKKFGFMKRLRCFLFQCGLKK